MLIRFALQPSGMKIRAFLLVVLATTFAFKHGAKLIKVALSVGILSKEGKTRP